MNSIRAPSGTPGKKKKFAWFRNAMRVVRGLFSYRIKIVQSRERQREAIENIEELARYLATIRSGTEFRWTTEHLIELITALERSPYLGALPGLTARDLRAFHELRRALGRARQASAINDRSSYADYIDDLLTEAKRRSAHVRPLRSRYLLAKIDRKPPEISRPGIFKRYRKVFWLLFWLVLVLIYIKFLFGSAPS